MIATSTAPAPDQDDDDQKLALKFLGMSAAIENPPEVGDVQTFTVTARCVGYGADERQSGGLVGYRKMRVLDVEPGEIKKAPPQAEQLTLSDPPPLGEDPEPAAVTPLRPGPYDPFARPADDDDQGDDADDADGETTS